MSKQHEVSALLVDAVVVLSAWCYVLLVHSQEDDIICEELRLLVVDSESTGFKKRAAIWFWAALFQ